MGIYLKTKISKAPLYLWILLAIILISFVLQAYNLHSWLDFGNDQVDNAQLVGKVLRNETPWPLFGPDMSDSGKGGRENRFHIGPMYYYFQIISAKIFGMAPEKLAYPDLFFSVLSIPLFFVFLSRYFHKNLSLALTGLYSFSFYLLKISHSAWNPHLIPFFILLFLLSIYKMILGKGKAIWIWAGMLGIALGVGIQLHAILLVLMPAITFFVFVYLTIKNKSFILKGAPVILLALLLNAGQISSELKNDFKNSRVFYKSVINTQKSKDSLEIKAVKNIDCQIDANAYILTSFGDSNCDFPSVEFIKKGRLEDLSGKNRNPGLFLKIIAALIFSLLGYAFLFSRWKKELDERKRLFLSLIILYAALAFLVMLPVIEAPIRYFIHLFFLPYIFLGFIINWLEKKISPKYFRLVFGLIIGLIFLANAVSVYPVVQELISKNRSSKDAIVLGEMEAIADYMIAESHPQREAYFSSSNKYSNFFNPIMYVAERQGFDLIRVKKDDKIPENKPVFYVLQHSENKLVEEDGRKVIGFKNFGQTDVYELEN